MNIKEIALNVADSLRGKIDGISHMQSNQGLVRFAEALISTYKAELLKEVGEPVAYYDPDLDCGSAGISFDPLSDGIGLYTSDQVAAAVAFAEALIAEIAKQNEPVGWFKYDKVSQCWHPQYDEYAERYAKEQGWQQLYTFPPTAEQIANETAEAWQPIETAPKDGTLFLGWVGGERWSSIDGGGSGYAHDVSQVDFCWWRADFNCPNDGYFDNGSGQIGDSQGVTHWMPLPTPPKQSMEGV